MNTPPASGKSTGGSKDLTTPGIMNASELDPTELRRFLAEISAENDHPFDDMFRNILSQPKHSVGVQCGSSVSTKNVGNDAGQFSFDVLQSITPSNSVDKNKNQSPLAPTEIAGKMPVLLKRKQSDLDKDEQTKTVKHF